MLTLVVQAGGQSRRMGSDKGLMPFLGQPLIQRVIERISPLADEVLVTTNRPEDYRFLDLPLFADLEPGRGALGGLYTALQAASHPLVAVVACDMPFASPLLFYYLRDVLLEGSLDVGVPSSPEGFEPLHAVYRRETCLPAVQAAIRQNAWKLISWFSEVRVHVATSDVITRIDPHSSIFMNVNTPADLQLAEKIARSSSPG
jgi:molybdopterin-guanine dinucleotide biosynthesis protein A